MYRRLTFFCFLFLVCQDQLRAQSPALYFDKLNVQSGLSHNKVNCILRDQRGFMWFGTNDGLNRYDGHEFTIFQHRPGDSSSISGNIINSILEDERGVLWIATADGGLCRYDYRQRPSRQFRQYRHQANNPQSIPVNSLNTLLLDRQGLLWIGSGGAGLLRFDRRREQFSQPVLTGTRTVLALALGLHDTLWVGRVGGGILKINTSTLQYSTAPGYDDLYAKLPHAAVTAMYADRQNQLWFGSWDKLLYRRSLLSHEEVHFTWSKDHAYSFSNDEITSFTADSRNRIWIGGRQEGLHIYEPWSRRFYQYRYDPAREGSLADNHINYLYTDPEGVCWIGTDRGISIHRPAQQQFEQTFLSRQSASLASTVFGTGAGDSYARSLVPAPVTSPSKCHSNSDIILYDFYERGDELWIGTSAGIFVRRPGSTSFILLPVSYNSIPLRITCIFEDVDGAVYLGTDYSLFRLDIARWQVTLLPNTRKDRVMHRLIDSRIVSIVRDTIGGHPVLLTAPYGHYIAYYDLVTKRWVSRYDSVANITGRFNLGNNHLIRKAFKTRDGRLWLATVSGGLGMDVSKDPPAFRFFSNQEGEARGLPSNHVSDVQEDASGGLWVSTYGGGLHYLDQDHRHFAHISASNNLLEGLQVDGRGQVWMISNGHLHKYDPQLHSYVSFGLPDIDKSGGVRGNIFQDRKGKLYVAGTNYFIVFDPLAVQELHSNPQVQFTDFRIFNESNNELLQDSCIRLSYGQNYFTVMFAAPDFQPGRTMRYQYQLEGRDEDWIDIGTRNTLEFSNLEARDYLLKVRATSHTGRWNNQAAHLSISIVPPFWQRWWFYAICGCSIGVIFYFICRYRIDQLLKQQTIRNKIAQDLHDNVGSTLSSISVYSQVAKIYHEQSRRTELQQTLEKISATSVEMISEMNDIVWTINPRHDSMDTILQRMESFARPLLASQGIHFHFEVEPSVKMVNLEMSRRKNFYLIYKEAVNNALKYSQCKNLWVKIGLRQHQLHLVTVDDGVGFDMQQAQLRAAQSLSGNGLRNMEMRAEEMKGLWHIDSLAGRGTTVHLRFPVV
ncbi:sensor histidine kinase [Paraflavitalea pollutisoli]|uniref:sensor histidine kinase n=1 Tax=Paraflavitalea pollutisoli TaxID=3034143 RepID=UPI0023ED6FD9|nr:sensor histidine kinase [Paraflavitalea sp. H1-2-19X]